MNRLQPLIKAVFVAIASDMSNASFTVISSRDQMLFWGARSIVKAGVAISGLVPAMLSVLDRTEDPGFIFASKEK